MSAAADIRGERGIPVDSMILDVEFLGMGLAISVYSGNLTFSVIVRNFSPRNQRLRMTKAK